MIKRQQTVSIQPFAEEIAKEFCNMDADEQARFFNEVSRLSAIWKVQLCFQIQSITDSKNLEDGGRDVMETIGEYSRKIGGSDESRS